MLIALLYNIANLASLYTAAAFFTIAVPFAELVEKISGGLV
jgi:hypothetical protein